MAKKITLDSRAEPLYSILGISCHLQDYRLSFLLNRKLRFGLRRTEDIYGVFSLYIFRDEECRVNYYLISNRGDEKALFPEHRQTDFIMLLEGPVKKAQLNKMLSAIKAIPNVLTAFEFNGDNLKNFPGFLSDLEMHMMNIHKKKTGSH